MVSIRTPVQGVTVAANRLDALNHGFNPHARAGRDLLQQVGMGGERLVSIRTPVQGVTSRIRRASLMPM